MDENYGREKNYPLSVSKMSKTPSWVMLGFVLGGLFVFLFFPRGAKTPPAPAPVVAEPKPEPPREPGPLSKIEAVFEDWGQYAAWSDNITEVALWDPALERFADYYEVRRIESNFYFRTIPRLTRRIIARGKPIPDCPLQFTETEEQYREWYDHGRQERPIERLWQKPPPPPAANVTPAAPVVPNGGRVELPAGEKLVLPKVPSREGGK